ncbi:hypothetical protein HDV00_004239 [Rhizophlyctis rosea]|nr:hypothetical protein HDV00_004239 [Rhizophlyctis rosea]
MSASVATNNAASPLPPTPTDAKLVSPDASPKSAGSPETSPTATTTAPTTPQPVLQHPPPQSTPQPQPPQPFPPLTHHLLQQLTTPQHLPRPLPQLTTHPTPPQPPTDTPNPAFKKLKWFTSTQQHFNPDDSTPLDRKRRRRTTKNEQDILEAVFRETPLPNAALREQLANETGMTPRGVQVWFQNRRQSLKKKIAERIQKERSKPPRNSTTAAPSPSPATTPTTATTVPTTTQSEPASSNSTSSPPPPTPTTATSATPTTSTTTSDPQPAATHHPKTSSPNSSAAIALLDLAQFVGDKGPRGGAVNGAEEGEEGEEDGMEVDGEEAGGGEEGERGGEGEEGDGKERREVVAGMVGDRSVDGGGTVEGGGRGKRMKVT